MTQIKEFMLLFRYEPSSQEPSAEEVLEMHRHWGAFIGDIARQGKLVSTYQLGFDSIKICANQTTENGFHQADGQKVGGNMVLKAESIESATELAKKCPILFIGGTVEVRNVLPMN